MKKYFVNLTKLYFETFFLQILNKNLTIGGASMNFKTIMTIMAILLSTSFAMALPKSVQIPVEEILNVRLNSQNRLNVSSYVVYPNSCFKSGYTSGLVDERNKVIRVEHNAFANPGMCTQVETPKVLPEFEIYKPQNGTYRILDDIDNRHLGDVSIDDSKVTFWRG